MIPDNNSSRRRDALRVSPAAFSGNVIVALLQSICPMRKLRARDQRQQQPLDLVEIVAQAAWHPAIPQRVERRLLPATLLALSIFAGQQAQHALGVPPGSLVFGVELVSVGVWMESEMAAGWRGSGRGRTAAKIAGSPAMAAVGVDGFLRAFSSLRVASALHYLVTKAARTSS